MTHLAEVHTLYETNARSVPDMLRQAADNIETETLEGYAATKAIFAIQLTGNGAIQIYGWGDCDNMSALAMIERGKAALMQTFEGPDQ